MSAADKSARSLWLQTPRLPSFPPQSRDLRTDVLIIGGGLAGLLTAHFLKQEGVDCVLIEANSICGGITGNTTAKITAQHGLIYHKLLRRFGEEKTQLYLQANREAVEQYRVLCGEMDCDFSEDESFVYSVDSPEKLEQELTALSRLGFPAGFSAHLPLPFPTVGAVRFPGQARFHPLKFAAAIAKGLPIREHTRALSWDGRSVVTNRGTITAEKIVAATHFPLLNKHGSYFMKLYQSRSYVLALEGTPLFPGMYVDESGDGFSFRRQGELLLVGGGSHRTGKAGNGWEGLKHLAQTCYPTANIRYRWAAQDCMTLDDVPYIGSYSAKTKNLFVATGFNKWGMTTSMAAALLLTDLVQGRDNPYAPVFSPSRTMLRPQLLVNGGQSALHLLTPTLPRCPHMGCALKWNRHEESWDCPCHGSRFAADGTLLDNPANGGLPTKTKK